MSRYKVVCKGCNKIIVQCHGSLNNKTVTYILCSDCLQSDKYKKILDWVIDYGVAQEFDTMDAVLMIYDYVKGLKDDQQNI